MFSKTKVKFQEQQLDDYVLENSVLKSKLQSKIEALAIMSKELDKSSMERDRYKVIVEQVKCSPWEGNSQVNGYQYNGKSAGGGELLARTREQNSLLKLELESVRSKLEEASGDVIALRKELQGKTHNANNKSSTYTKQDYENLIQELEKIHKKYQKLQLDYSATLDEKEELAADRDYYKAKVQRLNHQVSYILTSRTKAQKENAPGDPPKPIVDIDAIIAENKYLHERITQLEVEKEIIKRTLAKYKALLENRNKTNSLNLQNGALDVMTQKQVRNFLDPSSKASMKKTSAAELKSLSLGLFEALNDKSIALQHQRKTNQILANRISELEKTLESWCNGEKYIPSFPSEMLLEEYLPEKTEHLRDASCVGSAETESKAELNLVRENDVKNDSSSDTKSLSSSESDGKPTEKIVLPPELEMLVQEALAEIRMVPKKETFVS